MSLLFILQQGWAAGTEHPSGVQSCWVKASIQLLGTHLRCTPWTDCSSLHLSPLPPLHQCPPLCICVLWGAAPSLQPLFHEHTDLLYFSNFSPFHVQSEAISCSHSLGGHQPPCYDYIGLPKALQGWKSSEGPGQFFPSWLLIIVFALETLWQRSTSLDQLLATPEIASRGSQ